MSAPWPIRSCHYCGRVATCPHLYYEGQIRSVSASPFPGADAVTGHPLPATDGSSTGVGAPVVSGHQSRDGGKQ